MNKNYTNITQKDFEDMLNDLSYKAGIKSRQTNAMMMLGQKAYDEMMKELERQLLFVNEKPEDIPITKTQARKLNKFIDNFNKDLDNIINE